VEIFGWIGVVLLLFCFLGFFLKIGAALLNIALILGIIMLIGSFIFGRKNRRVK
jgi:hypothetical protein